MKQCKHCNKVKSKHQPETLHCPIKSRGFVPVFGTEHVYDEYETDPVHFAIVNIKLKKALNDFDVEFDKNVAESNMFPSQIVNHRTHVHSKIKQHFNSWILPELTKNAVLKVELNGVSTEYDAEWIGNIVHEKEKALSDLYFSANWDDSFTPVMTVTCVETGQVSIVTYDPENADLISADVLAEKVEEVVTVGVAAINHNAVLIINFDGEHHSYDVEWSGNKVLGAEEAINDLYFTDKFKVQLDSGIPLTLLVCDDDSGEVSFVKCDDERTELTSDNNRDDLLKDDEELTLDYFKNNIEKYILPLHDKQWVYDELKKYYLTEYSCYDPKEMEDEFEEIIKNIKSSNYDIIVGKPNDDIGMYSTDSGLMFGFKDDGYVDDQSIIEYIIRSKWEDIENAGILDIGSMESYSNVEYNPESHNITGLPKSEKAMKKEIDSLLSEIIGKSLLSPDTVKVESTADCKALLKSEYNVQKAKRVKKEKWGKIEYRLFESDDGEHYTIVSYNDKLISHYAFDYSEDF